MTQYLSDKFKLLSFFLIILVLFIHSGFHTNEIEGMFWNIFVQDVISAKIATLAVPLFFIISGYLFFINITDGFLSIKRKIKTRIRSLFVPYILGCVFFVAFYASIQLVPAFRNYMNNEIQLFHNQSIQDVLLNVFWISGKTDAPMAFHLWFIRDLLIIVLLSPVLYFFIKRLKWLVVLIMFALTYLTSIPVSLLTSLFWFSIGAVFAITKISIEYKKSIWGIISFIIYLLLSFSSKINESFYLINISTLLTILGIIGIWYGYDYIVTPKFNLKENKWLSKLSTFTFFIYVFHEPSLNIVRKLIVVVLGKNSTGYLISYLFSPFIFVFSAALIGLLLQNKFPKIYSILVGGRNSKIAIRNKF